MKRELEAIQKQFEDMEAAYQQKLEAKDKQIADLKVVAKLTRLIENIPEIAQAAEDAGKSLDDYIFDVIDSLMNPKMPMLPMPPGLYKRFAKIAEMRGMSMATFMFSEDMQIRITNALDNLVY